MTICESLWDLGVRYVFGIPGSQNTEFFEDLRKSRLKSILTTSETAAAFMAIGHARLSGLPGVFVTIPGPGVTYALPGLAEAKLDSVPLLHVVAHRPLSPGRRFRHQEIDHLDLLRPLVKEVVQIERAEELTEGLERAWSLAQEEEPGPVVLWISSEAWKNNSGKEGDGKGPAASHPANGKARNLAAKPDPYKASTSGASTPGMPSLARRLALSRRPIVFLGLGAVRGASQVLDLVERLGAPFLTTGAARGVIPEDHPLCLPFDFDRGGVEGLNDLFETSDLILSLGCKFSHNGTGGFSLRIPEDRLVHVNTDSTALGANYPASLLIHCPVEELTPSLLKSISSEWLASKWSAEEIDLWRSRIAKGTSVGPDEPSFLGLPSGSVQDLVGILQDELPRDAIIVTDSGLHQTLMRRYFQVLSPRGLITPSDFQSMGFGLPAAMGAKLAAPDRVVLAVIGDGGLAMSGMELLTLARERIPVSVLVFSDGYLNLIRLQQERDFGHAHAVRLWNPDMEAFSEACGVGFVSLDSDVRERVRSAIRAEVPTLVEVPLGDSRKIRLVRSAARVKALARRGLGERVAQWAKAILSIR